MRASAAARSAAVGLAGFVAGALLTLSVQSSGELPMQVDGTALGPNPVTTPEPAATFLAWTSGGLPPGTQERAAALPGIERVVVVRSDTAWLTHSYSVDGEVVDEPPRGFAIPLDVAAVDPHDFAPFLPPVERGAVVALADGEGILGATSARLRGLGVGAVLVFGDARVEVAAIFPDELVGAHELMVSRRVGARIGVTHDRYALIQPDPVPSTRSLARKLSPILPPDTPVRVRAPGETPYFRQGDAVLPPVIIKTLFGEFSARPTAEVSGSLTLDPGWVRTNIEKRRVPLLGEVTCNVAVIPQLEGAMRELARRGLGDLVSSFHGCFVPRFVRGSLSTISHHSWGIAFDINLEGNRLGETPRLDPRLVRVLERWGFAWGGNFIIPDGSHFEYHRPPPG